MSSTSAINFIILGAILLSLYYLFLWDPYKNASQYPTQSAQASNAPAPPTPQSQSTPTEATPSMNFDDSSTLSDITLNKVVEDLNKGMEPKALALAIKALANKEAKEDKHLEVPLHLFKKGTVKFTNFDNFARSQFSLCLMKFWPEEWGKISFLKNLAKSKFGDLNLEFFKF